MLGHPFQASYWKDVQGVIMHLVCPLMFMFDYLLFSKHRTLKLSAPLFSGIMPLIYVILILVRGELVIGTGTLEYPYYFLNAHANGYLYVIIYLLVLNILFMALGYAVWAYDKLVKIPEGKLKWDFSPLPKEVDINVSSEDPNNIESVENKDNNKTE